MKHFAVLVASADNRKDIFDICFANAAEIWKDCDWPRYVGLGSPYPDKNGFKVVTAVETGNWCEEVSQYIKELPSEIHYVLLMVEDVLFTKPIDGGKLNEIAWWCSDRGISYLRLVPLTRNWLGRLSDWMLHKYWAGAMFRPIPFREPYYSSTEMVIWRKDYLLKMLTRAHDAWSFEHLSGDRSHWAVWEPVFEQHQIVNKGRWNRGAPKLLACNIDTLTQTRPMQSRLSYLRGLRENLSFTLFGFSSFRFKRWLYGKNPVYHIHPDI